MLALAAPVLFLFVTWAAMPQVAELNLPEQVWLMVTASMRLQQSVQAV
jgi:hypothetical protein